MVLFSKLPHTIIQPVCDELSFSDLASFNRASKSTQSHFEDYCQTTFSPYKLYGPFFSSIENITEFRVCQARHGALVSGSALVSFLSRGSFVPGDLDVFVPSAGVVGIGLQLLKSNLKFVSSPLGNHDDLSLEDQKETFIKAATAPRSSWLEDVKTILEEGYDELTISGVFHLWGHP
ncbi:hypothetical protein VNI00_018035 [Paramarasmius palmivorus]|uniref:F-box domain-containing protein n=1 Tax=Paramarasmius palmivorus TaxID=297713 RepID=A0AAW0B227_9AGAR